MLNIRFAATNNFRIERKENMYEFKRFEHPKIAFF